MNRYGFAYAGGDVVNQAFKNLDQTAPGLIKDLSNELNKITEQRIQQLINEGGETLQKFGPKLVKDAIENTYQTPFKILGKFGKKKFAEIKQKVNKELKKHA